MTPDEVVEFIPMSFDMWHFVDEFPGVAKFPVDEWMIHDAPLFSSAVWCKLAAKIARKEPDRLKWVLEKAESIAKEGWEWFSPNEVTSHEAWDYVVTRQVYPQVEGDQHQQGTSSSSWQGASSSSWQ